MKRDQLPKISLFCSKDGVSKEYHAEIKEVEGGYIVQTRHGKRGAAKEPKTVPPILSFDDAVKEFDSIVKEKTSPKKGYTEDVSGLGYATTELEGRMSGNLPHLLVPVSEERMREMLMDDLYGFEPKIDGEHLMVEVGVNGLMPSNKLGVINSVPNTIHFDLVQLRGEHFIVDGESLDGKMYIFDIVKLKGQCQKRTSMKQRHELLTDFVALSPLCANLEVVPLALGVAAKTALLERVIANNEEGIVAKLLSAPYVPGKATPTTATQFKWVINETSSCYVVSVHASKRTVEIAMFNDDGSSYPLGNLTIPSNAAMPKVMDILDVRYRHLYQFGALCQAVYVKSRNDVLLSQCKLSQITRIKIKTIHSSDGDD